MLPPSGDCADYYDQSGHSWRKSALENDGTVLHIGLLRSTMVVVAAAASAFEDACGARSIVETMTETGLRPSSHLARALCAYSVRCPFPLVHLQQTMSSQEQPANNYH